MTCAYDEAYIEDAQNALGTMLEFAVLCQRMEIEHFYQLFLASDVSRRFALGDPSIIGGRSGVELAWQVLEDAGIQETATSQLPTDSRSAAFWAGWILAYYQWDTGISFNQIDHALPVSRVIEMYSPFHEMDVRHFCDAADKMMAREFPTTNLKRLRTAAGYSQSQLAKSSGISVRTIQHHEQRQKDINRAQFNQVIALSRALGCQPQELLEPLGKERYDYAVVKL